MTREERVAVIDSYRTGNGGWTANNLKMLGVEWPPKSGWRKALINSDSPLPPMNPNPWQPAPTGNGHLGLRDYLIGQALSGIMANPNFFGSLLQQDPDAAADFAILAADSVLGKRKEAPRG